VEELARRWGHDRGKHLKVFEKAHFKVDSAQRARPGVGEDGLRGLKSDVAGIKFLFIRVLDQPEKAARIPCPRVRTSFAATEPRLVEFAFRQWKEPR